MINKIKNKIKQWLFSEEIKELQLIKNQIEKILFNFNNAKEELWKARNSYREAYDLTREAQLIVNKMLDVGVDVHMKDEFSWAVICLQGRPEYVKFIPLTGYDAKNVLMFLRQFEGSNRVIDSHLGFKDMVKNWWL